MPSRAPPLVIVFVSASRHDRGNERPLFLFVNFRSQSDRQFRRGPPALISPSQRTAPLQLVNTSTEYSPDSVCDGMNVRTQHRKAPHEARKRRVGHGPAMEAAVRAAMSASSRKRIPARRTIV